MRPCVQGVASVVLAGVIFGCVMLLRGRSHLQRLSRIIGGVEALPGQFPWQASLRLGGQHVCGCVFIGKHWVLTAAHCFHGRQEGPYIVVLGSNHLLEDFTSRTFQVKNWIKHPEYIKQKYSGHPNDIAVVKVSGHVTPSDVIQAARLPSPGQNFTGHTCTISGWGIYDSGKETLPNTLQQTSTHVISNELCRAQWGPQIRAGHLCVYTGTSNPCSGDSGGPLCCGDTLAGLVSWGSNKCMVSTPGVFTRVSFHRQWIHDQTGI